MNRQTKKRALLFYTLGVNHLMLAIKEINNTEPRCSRKRFTEIISELQANTKKVRCNPTSSAFVRISCWQGFYEKGDNY